MWGSLLKAVLDWLTGLAREDTKAGDADDTLKALKIDGVNAYRNKNKSQKMKKIAILILISLLLAGLRLNSRSVR
jgi:hypothetical protein